MAIKLENKTNVDPVSGSFPYGKIRDKTSTTAGTPVNTSIYGDFHQFFAKILDKSGVIANGLLENLTNGFQYFESLLKLGFKYNSDPIIRGLIGSYTTGDLIILHGVVITVIGNNATWTEGAIYYNKKAYLVNAGAVTKATIQTFVFVISNEEESLINVIAGAPGSTIADYNEANVKPLYPITTVATDVFTSASILSATTDVFISEIQAVRQSNIVTMHLSIKADYKADSGGGASSADFVFNPNYAPKATGDYRSIVDGYIIDGSSNLVQIREINFGVFGPINSFRVSGTNTNNGGAYPRSARFNISISYEV